MYCAKCYRPLDANEPWCLRCKLAFNASDPNTYLRRPFPSFLVVLFHLTVTTLLACFVAVIVATLQLASLAPPSGH